MIDRRLLDNFDWGLLLMMVALALIGVMTIYSATRPVLDAAQKSYYMRQLYWIALSLVAFLLLVSLDYKLFIRYAYVIYALGIILLVLVLVIGRKGMGAQRWLNLWIVSFQPSEFFKLLFIVTLSRYLSYNKGRAGLGLKIMIKMVILFLIIPLVLILKQPDLGTALILFFIFIAMILAAGAKRKIILTLLIVSLISLPFAGKYVWSGLKDYQKQRILTFIDPQADPQGVGYHINQSKVSIGSGGFSGKGYLEGTQGPYRFLPENHTDFIFSIFAEEWGFLGSLVLFFMYFFIIWRGFDTAEKARDREGCFLALGITYMFSFYFFVNVGMTLGIMPVVGAPLPLMSYGGTALLSNFLALGILENVRMRRFALYY
ncbi:MAG: rod shape-determining protein RodA [Nitrospiraceae bacterium]|nr:MAG: rod shape-determining protein RodA [Nitrospiraceae bacterium]